MASYHLSELDNDSAASSPRSDHLGPTHDLYTRVRFMCSFGGKILPRPHDNQLRYVGGDTRIVAVHRATNFSTFITKLSKLSGISNVSVKYQLPNEDLDALISVTTDEDLENMFEEYDRVAHNQNRRSARLRIFLFSKDGDESSRPSSISSLLDGSANREHWFLDALNGTRPGLERGRSEVSSIVSEVPDYLFGLDNSEETQQPPPPQQQSRDPKLKTRNNVAFSDNVSVSDPGSPCPVVSSPFCSTSSSVAPVVPSLSNLPPVKTKPDNPVPVMESKQNQIDGLADQVEQPVSQPSGYSGNPMWHYVQDTHYSAPSVQQIPVYYVQGTVQPGKAPVQTVPMQAPYVQHYPVSTGQIPVGYHQMVPGIGQAYGGTVRPVMTMDQPYPDRINQQVYYGVRNPGLVPGYPGAVVPGGEELQRTGSDTKSGQISHPS